MQRYNPKDIEPKWQQTWQEQGIYQAAEDPSKPKKYVLEYFPYPSGAAMHVGHVRNYVIGDALARYDRMNGCNVLHPMGWDAFGLPAENFAIKNQVSPREAINQNTAKFKQQLIQMGFGYDWSREIDSTDPKYYQWTQWFFKLLFEKGLAYQQESLQWWCPVDKTVLANEQVEAGKCWRCGSVVEKKPLKQWFFKITDYADRLADDLDKVEWSDAIKHMQRNWIGKSKGAEIEFPVRQGTTEADRPNFLILHGWEGRNDRNFIPWLKRVLEGQGYAVQAPSLPHSDKPTEAEQVQYVLDNCDIDEHTVVIGHSLGCAVAMKILPRLPQPVAKLVLVASIIHKDFLPDGEAVRSVDSTFDLIYDFERVCKQAKDIIVISDSLEAERREKYLKYLSEQLHVPLMTITAEQKHVTAETEPALLPFIAPSIKVFSTAHDTIYGVTFMVLAPEHPLVQRIVTPEHKQRVENYIKAAQAKSDIERQETDRKKTGVFTGAYAINPANNQQIPVWIADYVLAGYGTGAVMAVPGEDERDYEFAKQFDLPVVYTTKQQQFVSYQNEIKKHPHDFQLANSEEFDGLDFKTGRQKILEKLESLGAGKEVVNYKIRDWLISRQRYWGAPIPIVHCRKDGAVAVPDDELPVKLPELTKFEPSGDGRSPLANVPEFVNTICPKCGGPAERETDTMDGFACSSWYFLRFADPHNEAKPFDADKAKFWLPVDDYIGGAEHAVMHLLYARFWTKVMFDEGLINFDEPFSKLRNHGMILAPDGSKMSKSKGNTIEPGVLIDQGYGADATRIMELFIAPWNQAAAWSVEGMGGSYRFLNRVWTLVQEFLEHQEARVKRQESSSGSTTSSQPPNLLKITHKTIKKVTDDFQNLSFNTAVAALMEAVNELYKIKVADQYASDAWPQVIERLLQLLAPFAPHISEELWRQCGHQTSVHVSSWPQADKAYLVETTVTLAVQVNGKLRDQLEVSTEASETEITAQAQAAQNTAAHLAGKQIVKTVYVPGKIVNFVVK